MWLTCWTEGEEHKDTLSDAKKLVDDKLSSWFGKDKKKDGKTSTASVSVSTSS